jgi:hypothetical protein
VCAARRRKGPHVCKHDLTFAVPELDDAILGVIEGQVLAPTFVDRVLESAYPPAADPTVLQTERAQLTQQINNLTSAIAAGGQMEELVAALKDRKRRFTALDASLRADMPDRTRLRAAIEQRVADWRDVLRAEAPQGRQVLRQILGPIHIRVYSGDCSDLLAHEGLPVTPGPHKVVDFEPTWCAETRPEGLLHGLIQSVASPSGYAVRWKPTPPTAVPSRGPFRSVACEIRGVVGP